jgi:hypothetical protein
VDNGNHFISGLPRAGTTLLAALLRQNPNVHAAAISPVSRLVSGLVRDMSVKNAMAMFISNEQRARVLKSCIEGFYAHIHPDQLVFDTDLGWTAKLPFLAQIYPDAKVICCVRSPAWVLDSLERLARGAALAPSGLIAFATEDTVYARAESLMGPRGLVGYPLAALRRRPRGHGRSARAPAARRGCPATNHPACGPGQQVPRRRLLGTARRNTVDREATVTLLRSTYCICAACGTLGADQFSELGVIAYQ